MVLASILQSGIVPDRIRMQMELSGGKAAEVMMYSVFVVQGKEMYRSKFDMIGLNAFLLQYLYSNYNLSVLESMDNMAGYIKNKFKTYLLKNRELVNSPDYVYEMLCREFARISRLDTGGTSGKDRLEEAVTKITLPYQYDRTKAIDAIKNRIVKMQPATVESRIFQNSVPFVIEPVEIPLVSEKISIIDDSPIQDIKPQIKDLTGQVSQNESKKPVVKETIQKSNAADQEDLIDPERYYPENYRIVNGQDWEKINAVYDDRGFPFIKEVGNGYILAAEKCSHSGEEGILFVAGDEEFYFYRLNSQSDNKAIRELIRRLPLMITMKIASNRIYEYPAKIKCKYTGHVSVSCCLPQAWQELPVRPMQGVS